jgi:SAM-dependent methyltransferase
MGQDHLNTALPASPWVQACLAQLHPKGAAPAGLRALDLACGAGRHACYLASLGYQVHAVDKALPDRAAWPANVHFEQMDLEQQAWPLAGQQYDLIVVTNYLHRPHFNSLLNNLKQSGSVLLYETFMLGNEQYGSPRSPAFLLKPDELIELTKPLHVLRFEQGFRGASSPAMIQRVMCISGPWSEIQSGATTLIQRD